MFRNAFPLVVIAVCSGLNAAAQSTSVYINPCGSGGCIGECPETLSGPGFVILGPTSVNHADHGVGSARSLSEIGHIECSATSVAFPHEPFCEIRAEARALFELTDLIVTGPGGSVDVTLNYTVQGDFSLGATLWGSSGIVSFSPGPFSHVDVWRFYDHEIGGYVCRITSDGEFVGRVQGSCSGAHIDGGLIVSAPFNLPVGIPILFRLEVLTSTSAYTGEGGGSASASLEVRFVENAPLFNVPPGYAVNSEQGGVVNSWFLPAAPCPGDGNGDANCSGYVDFFDIDPFLLALFDLPTYRSTYCGGSNCAADVDDSGAVDFFDIDPFLTCLFTGCP